MHRIHGSDPEECQQNQVGQQEQAADPDEQAGVAVVGCGGGTWACVIVAQGCWMQKQQCVVSIRGRCWNKNEISGNDD